MDSLRNATRSFTLPPGFKYYRSPMSTTVHAMYDDEHTTDLRLSKNLYAQSITQRVDPDQGRMT